MKSTPSKAIARLWLEAVRSRWSLRLAAGESAWWLAWRMLCWLCVFPRQTRWLQTVDASPALRQAARTDPRLYERWHAPFISSRFGPDARCRIVAAHYAFVQQHLPARMRQRVLHGQDIRVATLRPAGHAPVSLHLRKPARAEAGELALLLLTGDKTVLATCALTFAGDDGLLVAALPSPPPQADDATMRAFLRSSHGVHPRELLHVLTRELATLHQLTCIHVTPLHAGCGEAARHPAPCHDTAPTPAQMFCRDACAAFLAAFHGSARRQSSLAKSAGPAPDRQPAARDRHLLATSP
ncbi:DUF535 domain-containing protein [Rhodanobacter glycinis]|uniref:DUF535 domain-containing protein n=1 Tax=Rhodanobacter glycinis TaxID=582702 RepID=A0A5B9E044_9GAMM|nr:DUF535 family protein [Rhodanobacter glycinis]QEE23800.1 DUF535 domain-containing protein [Rhodanobacter glycinis]